MIGTSEATIKGHLDQGRQNVQSTNKQSEPLDTKDIFPEKHEKTLNCYSIILDLAKEATIYTDLKCRFPHQSLRGNNYIFWHIITTLMQF